jgi:hypothetical protein
MSTLKVNNIEPTLGDNIRLTGNVTFITPAGKEIEFNDSDTNFNGPVTITGSLSTDKGDVLINEGNLILKSGSLLIGSGSLNQQTTTGSTSASYWSITSSMTVTGSEGSDWTVEVEGNTTVTGSFGVLGDTDFTGDVTISGCLDINCYNDEENPVFWAIDGRTTPAPTGFEYVSINFSTYGDLTAGIATAAAASNNVCYIYDPATGTYAPYGYAGTNFDGVVTYISASGPEIATGELVQIGFPFPIPGATPIYPIGTGSITPVASFCCDGITLYSDVTISGGLDVYGPTNLHDGLIVTGCIEMYCPGDEATAWYGYEGSVRFSKPSASVYLNYTWLDASYGDVRTAISASAAANGGTLQLYNTITGTTQTVNYISSTWTQTLTIIEYSTPTLTAYNPMPVIHIGNQTPDLQPDGADILMGSGSATPTQTATFCCDGNVLYGDTTFTGSVTITGSTAVTGSTTVTGPTEVTGSVNIKGDGKVDGNFGIKSGSFNVSGSVIVSGSFTNTGSFNNTGSITNTGSFNNSGSITNTGLFNNSGSIISTGSFNNTGSLTNTGSFNNTGSITNAGGFINTGSIVYSGSFTNVGNITVSGSIITSGSLIIPVLEETPAPDDPGTKGQMVFVVDSGNYYICGYLDGAWRSGSLF